MVNRSDEFRCVYSLGIRCYTEMILKDLGLRQFSSIFGSLFVKNFDNLKRIIETPNVLVDKEKHIYTCEEPSMTVLNQKHGFRTLHRDFDNIENYHSATQAHHDLSNSKDMNHFVRGIQRFEKMRNEKIPILFLNVSDANMFYNSDPGSCQEVIDTLLKSGWEVFHVVFLYFSGSGFHELVEKYSTPFYTLYEHGHYTSEVDPVTTGVIKSLTGQFHLKNLVTIEEIDF